MRAAGRRRAAGAALKTPAAHRGSRPRRRRCRGPRLAGAPPQLAAPPTRPAASHPPLHAACPRAAAAARRRFSTGGAAFTNVAVSGAGVPWVIYSDETVGGKATVMKLVAGVWKNVTRRGFTPAAATWTRIALTPAGLPVIAYVDANKGGKATVRKLADTGLSWVAVGPAGFTAHPVSSLRLRLDAAANPVLGYIEHDPATPTKPKATASRWTGVAWTKLPTAGVVATTSLPAALSLSLDAAGLPFLAFADGAAGAGGRVSVKRYKSGASWRAFGPAGEQPPRCPGPGRNHKRCRLLPPAPACFQPPPQPSAQGHQTVLSALRGAMPLLSGTAPPAAAAPALAPMPLPAPPRRHLCRHGPLRRRGGQGWQPGGGLLRRRQAEQDNRAGVVSGSPQPAVGQARRRQAKSQARASSPGLHRCTGGGRPLRPCAAHTWVPALPTCCAGPSRLPDGLGSAALAT